MARGAWQVCFTCVSQLGLSHIFTERPHQVDGLRYYLLAVARKAAHILFRSVQTAMVATAKIFEFRIFECIICDLPDVPDVGID